MPASVGFHASHELYSPSRLLQLMGQAEAAGFLAGSCSDHFHPWSERNGHSGFAWSWLGAALQATHLPLGVVCAPGQRYHPAIIAQAAATLLDMYPGRLWIAVGTGEAVNECITGTGWPDKDERNQRLVECVDIMRRLWRGESVTHQGLVQVQDARLFTRPAQPPLLIGAAMTAESAAWLAPWADGLITAGRQHDQLREIVAAFQENGGAGKPLFLQTAVSYDATEAAAVQAAYDNWRHAGLQLHQLSELTTPREFDRATANITPQTVASRLRCSADIGQHIEWLQGDFELGFSAVYLHYVGRHIEQFIDVFAEHVLPACPTC